LPTTGSETKIKYYKQERWPIYDFKKLPPTPSNYQIARKSQPQLKKKLKYLLTFKRDKEGRGWDQAY
jgi:hypothetical protein